MGDKKKRGRPTKYPRLEGETVEAWRARARRLANAGEWSREVEADVAAFRKRLDDAYYSAATWWAYSHIQGRMGTTVLSWRASYRDALHPFAELIYLTITLTRQYGLTHDDRPRDAVVKRLLALVMERTSHIEQLHMRWADLYHPHHAADGQPALWNTPLGDDVHQYLARHNLRWAAQGILHEASQRLLGWKEWRGVPEKDWPHWLWMANHVPPNKTYVKQSLRDLYKPDARDAKWVEWDDEADRKSFADDDLEYVSQNTRGQWAPEGLTDRAIYEAC